MMVTGSGVTGSVSSTAIIDLQSPSAVRTQLFLMPVASEENASLRMTSEQIELIFPFRSYQMARHGLVRLGRLC